MKLTDADVKVLTKSVLVISLSFVTLLLFFTFPVIDYFGSRNLQLKSRFVIYGPVILAVKQTHLEG